MYMVFLWFYRDILFDGTNDFILECVAIFVCLSDQALVLGTDRNGLLAAGPDLAGFQSFIRLAG